MPMEVKVKSLISERSSDTHLDSKRKSFASSCQDVQTRYQRLNDDSEEDRQQTVMHKT